MPNIYSDVPQAGHTLAFDQPLMEENFNYLANTLGTSLKAGDHQISVGGVDTNQFEGRHRQVCFNSRSPKPSVAGIGDGVDSMLFSKSGNIFFDSSALAGPYQMTTALSTLSITTFGTFKNYQAAGGGNAAITGGWTFLPGALILQYGQATTLVPGGSVTIQLAVPFPTQIISIVCTPRTSSAIGGGNHDWDVGTLTLTSFNLSINGNYNANDTFFFQVIGN